MCCVFFFSFFGRGGCRKQNQFIFCEDFKVENLMNRDGEGELWWESYIWLEYSF